MLSSIDYEMVDQHQGVDGNHPGPHKQDIRKADPSQVTFKQKTLKK